MQDVEFIDEDVDSIDVFLINGTNASRLRQSAVQLTEFTLLLLELRAQLLDDRRRGVVQNVRQCGVARGVHVAWCFCCLVCWSRKFLEKFLDLINTQ